LSNYRHKRRAGHDRQIAEDDKALPVTVNQSSNNQHKPGRGLFYVKIEFGDDTPVTSDPFALLPDEEKAEVVDAGYFHVEIPAIDNEHNTERRNQLAIEGRRCLRQLQEVRSVWEQALIIMRLRTVMQNTL
jgi:hypothetical protein